MKSKKYLKIVSITLLFSTLFATLYTDNNYVHSSNKQGAWIKSSDGRWWYYLKNNGSYARNEWQGSYYLKSNGKMASNEWIYDKNYSSWYYLKNNGLYARNEWQGSYYLKSNGKMASSEWIYDKNYGSWYYLKNNGKYARNEWQGNYYLKSNGKMAVNERVGNYIFDNSGVVQKEISRESENLIPREQQNEYRLSSDGTTYVRYYKNIETTDRYSIYNGKVLYSNFSLKDFNFSTLDNAILKYGDGSSYDRNVISNLEKDEKLDGAKTFIGEYNGKLIIFRKYNIIKNNKKYNTSYGKKTFGINITTGEKITEEDIRLIFN